MRYLLIFLIFLVGRGDKKKPLPTVGTISKKIAFPSYVTHDTIHIPIGDGDYIDIPTTEHHPPKYQITYTTLDEDEGQYFNREAYVSQKRFESVKEGEFFSVKTAETVEN